MIYNHPARGDAESERLVWIFRKLRKRGTPSVSLNENRVTLISFSESITTFQTSQRFLLNLTALDYGLPYPRPYPSYKPTLTVSLTPTPSHTLSFLLVYRGVFTRSTPVKRSKEDGTHSFSVTREKRRHFYNQHSDM